LSNTPGVPEEVQKTMGNFFPLRAVQLMVVLLAFFLFGEIDARADASPRGEKEVIDMVLASVDGDPLTMSDLRNYIRAHGEAVPADLLDGSPTVRKFLREMVVDDIVLREANSAGLAVTKDEIEAYIEEIRRQNGVDEPGFVKLLAGKGMTPEVYEKQVQTDILKTRLLSSRVRAKVSIMDTDVAKFLENEDGATPSSADRRLEQIAIPYEDQNPIAHDSAMEEAEKVLDGVSEGKSFATLGGRNYSDLGSVSPDDLIEPLQSAAKKLESGDTSKILTVPGKLIILHSAGAAEKKQIDTDEKERVRKQLFERAFKEEADKFLNDELPKKYHVELKL